MMSFNYGVPANASPGMTFAQPTMTLGSPGGGQNGPATGAGMPVTYVQMPATNLANGAAGGFGMIANNNQPMIFQMAGNPGQAFIAANNQVLQPSYAIAPNGQFVGVNNGTMFVQQSGQQMAGTQQIQFTTQSAPQAATNTQATVLTTQNAASVQGETQEFVTQPHFVDGTTTIDANATQTVNQQLPTPMTSTPQNPLIYLFESDTDMDLIKSTLPAIPSGDKWIRGVIGVNSNVTALELYDPEEEEKPKFVNPKQFNRIIKRRAEREKLLKDGRIPEERAKYLHESRHQHALNRTRHKDGRFDSKL